jgi:uncharacterized protein
MEEQRKYAFDWSLLGDLALGRPNLGPTMRVEPYRLMEFTFRDQIEQRVGTHVTDEIFFSAGKQAGLYFFQHVIDPVVDFKDFIRKLQAVLPQMGIGVLRVEKADLEAGSFVLTVSEDLDCSGLPITGFEICRYDEGFIAALLEAFTGVAFTVLEVDCWSTGDRCCRFVAEAVTG